MIIPRHLLALPLTIALLTACTSDQSSVSVEALQTDIEALENEVGRLEFRIYQLENADTAEGTSNSIEAQPDEGY